MNVNFPSAVPKKTPKEMLLVSSETGESGPRPVVRINFSSMDLINTCKRKALYALEKNLTSSEESSATLFGSAIHKGLEVWYVSPKSERHLREKSCNDDGTFDEKTHSCARCRAINAFNRVAEPLGSLDLGDKRHPYNGLRLLHKYFDQYIDDPFEVLCDDAGPIVERRVEFTLIDKPDLKVIYFGTIDAILKDTETGTILVTDHKTTSTLGSDFYNRIKPNFQYTGYVLGAKLALGIDTNLFLVNGLQVAKTKADLARQVTQRNEEDFDELKLAVEETVRDYLRSRESGHWPQNAPGPCNNWGGCGYRAICEVPNSIKNNVIESRYSER